MRKKYGRRHRWGLSIYVKETEDFKYRIRIWRLKEIIYEETVDNYGEVIQRIAHFVILSRPT